MYVCIKEMVINTNNNPSTKVSCNKFQHSAHPVLLIGEGCVKRCKYLTCSYSYRCLHIVLHSPDNHSMKAV